MSDNYTCKFRRQTGNVVTRQTFDRAPRITKPPTATFQGVTTLASASRIHGNIYSIITK